MRIFTTTLLILIGIALVVAYFTLFMVHQTQQAMVLEFGAPKKVITQPGLKWKIPFVQNVVFFDKRLLDLDSPSQQVLVLGKKRLVVDAFARYKIIDPLRFFQTIRNLNVARDRLSSIVNASLRRVLAKSSLDDVVRDKRLALMSQITDLVNKEAKDFGMEVVDVRIKRADLPEKISNDVFKRMRAERAQEAAQYRAEGEERARRLRAGADRKVVEIKAEATQKSEILRGEGDAERNRIYAEAFNQDPDFFSFYRSMQAYEEGLKAGDTRMLLSPDSEFFRYFNNPTGKAASPSGNRAGGSAASAGQ